MDRTYEFLIVELEFPGFVLASLDQKSEGIILGNVVLIICLFVYLRLSIRDLLSHERGKLLVRCLCLSYTKKKKTRELVRAQASSDITITV